MTLGCGGYGGNITSDNISPRHLLNVKRLAYEVTPAAMRAEAISSAAPLPKAPPALPVPGGIPAENLSRRIDEFLAARGYAKAEAASGPGASVVSRPPEPPRQEGPAPPAVEKPADFVCEDDVRQAVRSGRKISVGERTIVTPAARDLAEEHRIFVQAGWPDGFTK
jgi:hypothetical protein